ncbi:hypothetical protein V8F06_007305 [Rhypophila decipiens]
MQLNNIIISVIASAMLGAQALKVDLSQPDGLYAVLKDSNGVEFAQLIEAIDFNTTDPTPPELLEGGAAEKAKRALSKRESVGCQGKLMNTGDCDAVVNALKNYCGGGTGFPYSKTYWRQGNTFAYMCDYPGGQLCYSSHATHAFASITRTCGSYHTGWYHDNGKTYGYDYTTDGNIGFCGNM